MADFIKSSESLEHDQLDRREGWCSGSPRKSLYLSGGAGWRSWGQGEGKEGGTVFSLFNPGRSHPRGTTWMGLRTGNDRGAVEGWSIKQGPWLWPDGSSADSGLPRTRGPCPVWPAGLQAKPFCPQGLGEGP